MLKVALFGENRDLQAFPGSDGLPLLGHTLDYLKNHYVFSESMHRQFGNVYRLNAFWQTFVVLHGAEAAEFVLKDEQRLFSNKLGWEPFLGRLFPDALLTRDFDDHRYHRRIMQSAFKKGALVDYLDQMQRVIGREMALWGAVADFRAYPAIKALTLKIAGSVFMGIQLADEESRMTKAFLAMGEGLAPIVPYPVPGLALWRGLRGRQRIIEFLRPQIAQRRALPGVDVFTRLCQATDESGCAFSEQDILNHMVNILAAAHDTMTTALTVTIDFLAANQEWQQKARAECEAITEHTLDFTALDQLPLIEGLFKEALRLYPPGPQMYRRSVKACQFAGYDIPANTQVMLDVGQLHRDPLLWENPQQFVPTRFTSAAEHRHPYQWVPFGGGAHTCIGLHFAMMQAKAILFHWLRGYSFQRVSEKTTDYVILPITRPRCGLPLQLAARDAGE